MVKNLVRLEALFVVMVSLIVYFEQGGSWMMLLFLSLAPDITLLGYLINKQAGSIIYNLGHNYVLPMILIYTGWKISYHGLILIGLIWTFHIGIDRFLGFGLKYKTNFKDTHIQRL